MAAAQKATPISRNLTQVVAGGSSAESNLFWALVYVPQGTTAGSLNIATAGATPSSMYEPNQFVMNCGVIDPTAGPIRIYSPISRNLTQVVAGGSSAESNSYISQPQRRRQDLSPHPSYS